MMLTISNWQKELVEKRIQNTKVENYLNRGEVEEKINFD